MRISELYVPQPDEVQMALMKKTAGHIIASPNPVQFEMRILANHGEDSRFAFLRGRWPRVWKSLRASTTNSSKSTGTTGLVSYDDSGEEDE